MTTVGNDMLAAADHAPGSDPRRWATPAKVLMAAVLISLAGTALTVIGGRLVAGTLSVAAVGAIIAQQSRHHGLATAMRGAFAFAATMAVMAWLISWQVPHGDPTMASHGSAQ